jgi:hypothetical protein
VWFIAFARSRGKPVQGRVLLSNAKLLKQASEHLFIVTTRAGGAISLRWGKNVHLPNS